MKTGTVLGSNLENEEKGGTKDDDNTPYNQVVGCLLHISNKTRPDICYAAGYLSRCMNDPTHALWKAVKHVLSYLKGNKTSRIVYQRGDGQLTPEIHGYCDDDWGQENTSRK